MSTEAQATTPTLEGGGTVSKMRAWPAQNGPMGGAGQTTQPVQDASSSGQKRRLTEDDKYELVAKIQRFDAIMTQVDTRINKMERALPKIINALDRFDSSNGNHAM